MNFRVASLPKAASALLAALGACRATGSGATGPAPSSGPTAPGATTIDASASTLGSEPSLGKIPDGAERVYKGTIGSELAVVVRLRRQGSTLAGRYFYEKKGVDLDLSGALADNGHVALDEHTVPKKRTGQFEGAFEKDGTLAGTWKDEGGQHPLPFRLQPIAPAWTAGSPVTLHKKRAHLVRKPERPDTSPILKECSFDAAYPEVDGVLDPVVEAKINAKLHIKLAVPDARCESAESDELSYDVSFNRTGILSVVFDNNWCCGAHPSFSREFVNLTIPDGNEITLAGLFAPDARPKLAGLLRPLIAKLGNGEPFPGDDKELLDQLLKKPANFSIEDKGLRLSAFNSQPHVIQSMFAEGFLLPYPKLAALLKIPGPLDPLIHQ
jgi:hypothetical protein